jgi:hypothetical protein
MSIPATGRVGVAAFEQPPTVHSGPNPTTTRVQRLARDAAEAAQVRVYLTHPDVVALRVERVRTQVDRLCWAGIVLGLRRLVSWWQRSPRVPAALKSRRHAVQAGKDLTVAVLRSPWRLLGCVVRGLVAAGRAWRRWVTVGTSATPPCSPRSWPTSSPRFAS